MESNFFKKLKLVSGNVTVDNLKICAYIKMGLTNKQIAQLQNVTDRAVIISRNRIKKRLKLDEKEGLSHFIGSL